MPIASGTTNDSIENDRTSDSSSSAIDDDEEGLRPDRDEISSESHRDSDVVATDGDMLTDVSSRDFEGTSDNSDDSCVLNDAMLHIDREGPNAEHMPCDDFENMSGNADVEYNGLRDHPALLEDNQEESEGQSIGSATIVNFPLTLGSANTESLIETTAHTYDGTVINTSTSVDILNSSNSTGGSKAVDNEQCEVVRDKEWVVLTAEGLEQKVEGAVWKEIVGIWVMLQRHGNLNEVRLILKFK